MKFPLVTPIQALPPPTHLALLKMGIGWPHDCKAKHPLEIIVEHKQKLATSKSTATKKANTEKSGKARELMKAAKASEKASRMPERYFIESSKSWEEGGEGS